MNYETDSEFDFWNYFNKEKDNLSYFERERMINDYYGERIEFKNQYYIIVKCKELKEEVVLKKNKHLIKREIKVELDGKEYDFNFMYGKGEETYYGIFLRENMNDFLNKIKYNIEGKLKYEIFNSNIVDNEKFHLFFESDNIDIQIQKIETNIIYKTYFGIVVGIKDYLIIDEKGNVLREGKSNVIRWDVKKCFRRFITKFYEKTISNKLFKEEIDGNNGETLLKPTNKNNTISKNGIEEEGYYWNEVKRKWIEN
jgi:hypothetical protein